MQVKKFEAKSMKEALRLVKQELGPEAVILSARDNRKSFGLVGEGSVEVTAAVSDQTLQKKKFVESRMREQDRERFLSAAASEQKRIIDKAVTKRLEQVEQAERATERAPEVRRPITSTSYIDIPDEDEAPAPRARARAQAPGPRAGQPAGRPDPRAVARAYDRTGAASRAPVANAPAPRSAAAPERAAARQSPSIGSSAGRSVGDLLDQFADSGFAFEGDDEEKTEFVYSPQPPPTPRSERALSHIRSAAREAWSSGLMADEERASKGRVIGAFGKLLPSLRRAEEDAGGEVSPERAIERAADSFEMVPLSRARKAAPGAAAPARGGAAAAISAPEIESLKAEIQRLQEMIGGIHRGGVGGLHPGADFGLPFDLSRMFQKLTDAGVGAENAAEILHCCQREMEPLHVKKAALVDAWTARHILDATEVVADPFRGRVHLFLGGPGSGKTSTLVKMASRLVVNEKRRVAVVTTDAQKVGAIDQLKIYCQILNVPLAIVRSKAEWEWALSQLQAFDCILADFPGMALRDLAEIQALKSLLPPDSAMATRHLVIGATSKDGDALEIERRYRLAEASDLIFTNLDQSSQHGLIYNVQKKARKPLHSFGTGVRIPEDFEVASKERVLDLIFKLNRFKSPKPNAEAL